jgi:hypothetical protein
MTRLRPIVLALLLVAGAIGQQTVAPSERLRAFDRVTADSIRGHLSFLSSDLLEGRNTPSRGLDIAAEYIAGQFRRYGLEAPYEGTYFQESPIRNRRTGELTGTAKNVIGVIRGSDPALRDTCVLITAHYDHLGVNPNLEGDQIFNGANDNASGTTGVIELAAAFATMDPKPKRSIVFIAFQGEERGLLGSRHYAENPLFPIEKTVAMINLEQIGRTDDSEGPRIGAASMTGFDFSDVGPIFAEAAKAVGARIEMHPQHSASYFARSDNVALAMLGVPAHTICTAFHFAEYHAPGDHWEKIDAVNMRLIVRAIGAGVLAIADSEREPRWNENNPRAARYLEAWRERRKDLVPLAR